MEQRVTVEEAIAFLERFQSTFGWKTRGAIGAVLAEIADLRRQLAEAVADRERLDWLEEATEIAVTVPGHGTAYWGPDEGTFRHAMDTARAALDAAMAARAGQEGEP